VSDLRRLGEAPRFSRELLPDRPTTRFAPSVTGVLHLGHVLNAVVTWGLARALGGRVILRLEDHDRSRWRAEHEASILDDLEWLGLEPDVAPVAAFRAGPTPYRQSDASDRHEAALAQLSAATRIYACDCSRRDLAVAAPVEPGGESRGELRGELRYGGRCRDRGLAPGEGLGLRAVLGPGEERFVDAVLGPQVQVPDEQCGDLLVRDRLGQWTYQLAVVVDDDWQGVDLVVRGRDLLSSTGRQLRLRRLLGRHAAPAHAHHPLIGDAAGRKLSKSDGAAGLAALRAAGLSPPAVLGRAAYLGGLQDRDAAVRPRDLGALLERLVV